ncbi:hypothetical protein pdam_00008486 [Pocillopora damicornis]|uniref:Uncharacterized protein n=1 Tax=Pocillopora damicornis TaxID=46731 RepID=A0A3M6U4K7_POCDA|nr:hypothetical protein pdam_00008486 [Pocillopora damicornis]
MVDDKTTMSTALKQLENIQLMLKKSCSSTHGIPLRTSPVEKKLKITSTEYHQVFHKKLPPRRRWKKKTPKADVIFIEEDSNDDVDDDDAKRKATNFFVADLTASGDGEQNTVSQDDEANTTRLDLETLGNGSAKLPVLDRKQKTRYYFDPMNGRVHTIFSTSVPKSKLIELIDDISAIADLKTGWNCKSWLCVEPLHYTQTDSYNYGVIFARCLCEGLDINGSYDVDMERERITRNTAVCKICKDDDGEDWLGCDSCGQFFHASCAFRGDAYATFHLPLGWLLVRTSRVKILKLTIKMNQMMNLMSCTDLNLQDKKYSPW